MDLHISQFLISGPLLVCSHSFVVNIFAIKLLVREPAILLIKWLRPKGLKVFSYLEKYAEFKNQTLVSQTHI